MLLLMGSPAPAWHIVWCLHLHGILYGAGVRENSCAVAQLAGAQVSGRCWLPTSHRGRGHPEHPASGLCRRRRGRVRHRAQGAVPRDAGGGEDPEDQLRHRAGGFSFRDRGAAEGAPPQRRPVSGRLHQAGALHPGHRCAAHAAAHECRLRGPFSKAAALLPTSAPSRCLHSRALLQTCGRRAAGRRPPALAALDAAAVGERASDAVEVVSQASTLLLCAERPFHVRCRGNPSEAAPTAQVADGTLALAPTAFGALGAVGLVGAVLS